MIVVGVDVGALGAALIALEKVYALLRRAE
jgi:hypothetical protein